MPLKIDTALPALGQVVTPIVSIDALSLETEIQLQCHVVVIDAEVSALATVVGIDIEIHAKFIAAVERGLDVYWRYALSGRAV